VTKAIEDLERKGERPTAEAIRAITKGSFRDLLPAIRQAKAAREETRRALEQVPDMPAEVREVFEAAWSSAWRMADASAAEARKGFVARLEHAELEITDLQKLVGDVEEQRDQALAALEELRAKDEAMAQEVATLRAALAEAQAKLDERDAIATMLREIMPRPDAPDPVKDKQSGVATTPELPLFGLGPAA
jgi:chromosome segregation ATPase